jgi:hypothetical protein
MLNKETQAAEEICCGLQVVDNNVDMVDSFQHGSIFHFFDRLAT